MNQRPTNPLAQAFVYVALMAAFVMAIEAAVYQYAIAENLPPNASFTMPDLGLGAPNASPAATVHYGK